MSVQEVSSGKSVRNEVSEEEWPACLRLAGRVAAGFAS